MSVITAAGDRAATQVTNTKVIQPAWVRVVHWINAVAIVLMIMSGWQIYNASPLFNFTFSSSITLGGCLAAKAATCPRKGTLGTSRELEVDAATFPQIGSKNFPQTLPLRDHEVVLTFDDGPWPPTTPKVLAALAKECVRA